MMILKVRKGTKIVSAALALSVTFGMGTGTGYVIRAASEGTTVIEFIGHDVAYAKAWIDENGVDENNVVFTYEYSEAQAAGLIAKQSIGSGGKIAVGDTLRLTVSEGGDPDVTFELPDFTNDDESTIKAWFTNNQFTSVTYVYQMDEEATDGSFISLSPSAGTVVKRSEKIVVTLCDNTDKKVKVPDLANYSLKNIRAWAAANRISLLLSYAYSDTDKAGTVSSLSLKAGEWTSSGQVLTIVISLGEKPEEVAVEKAVNTAKVEADKGSASTAAQESSNAAEKSEAEATPETTPETTPEQYKCPESIAYGMYTGQTNIIDLLAENYGGCQFTPIYYTGDDNPENYDSIKNYTKNSDTQATVEIYKSS